jgi:hypothetical protein
MKMNCPICNKEITEFDLFWFADFNLDYWPFYEIRKICSHHYPKEVKEIKTTNKESFFENKAWNY